MNIGIVTTWHERGAAYVSRQYREVLEPKHRVFIYARGGLYAKGDRKYNDKQVTWGKMSPIPVTSAIDLKDFKNWISANKLDTVFFNEQIWWAPVLLCQEMGVKTGSYIDYYTKETVPLFDNFDFLICNTRRHFSAFPDHPQPYYIPWGTDVDLFQPATKELVHGPGVTFFHSSGFSPERKGTDLLIRAFDRLTGNGRLIVHAQDNMPKKIPGHENLISRLTGQGKMIYHQGTVEAPGLYHLGDVYVYPSRLDGIGLTIAEALACGLPVITTDNGPMNEFVNEDVGALVKVDRFFPRSDNYFWDKCEVDLDDLTRCMQRFVDQPEKIPGFKERARKHAVDHLNWTSHAPELLSIFEGATHTDQAIKSEAARKAREYERLHASGRMKLYHNYPWVFKTVYPVIRKYKRMWKKR